MTEEEHVDEMIHEEEQEVAAAEAEDAALLARLRSPEVQAAIRSVITGTDRMGVRLVTKEDEIALRSLLVAAPPEDE